MAMDKTIIRLTSLSTADSASSITQNVVNGYIEKIIVNPVGTTDPTGTVSITTGHGEKIIDMSGVGDSNMSVAYPRIEVVSTANAVFTDTIVDRFAVANKINASITGWDTSLSCDVIIYSSPK
jgi:hypothetical protein